MTKKQKKAIMGFIKNSLFDKDDIEELYEKMSEEHDFEMGKYRFIHQDYIDKIMYDEFHGDPCNLGYFCDWFIADNTNLSYEIVKALQEADKYEAIGNYIIDNEFLGEFLEEYVQLDGYGHYFAVYDSVTMEDLITEFGFYAFRIDWGD